MSEVLLQSIVEKLEAIEISLLKDNNPVKEDAIQALLKEVKSFKSELVKWPLQFEKSTEKIDELLKIALSIRLANPVAEQIKHSHHFHKGIWITIVLFIFFLCLAFIWMG
ncbi:MAG: hypothetical protein ACR2KX_18920 [Chitinophagaceae bacterium]